jgi:xylan 1,4-beta-xylosidase
MARSKNLPGPYEVHPDNPIMTAWETGSPIQKAGHGNLVDTPDGQWYGVFLCGRPNADKRCVLGRETAIERGHWGDDGWFRFDSRHPRIEVPAPQLPDAPVAEPPARDDFDAQQLGLAWNTLRLPHGPEVSLADRPGHLRLYGTPYDIESNNRQALVARRVEHKRFEATTVVECDPQNQWQRAGLTCYYCHVSYYWLRVAQDEEQGRVVELVRRWGGKLTLEGRIAAAGKRTWLRVTADGDLWQFAASGDGRTWQAVGEGQDGTILSDEAVAEWGFAFTGAYVGLAAVDISGGCMAADFDWFEYRPL